MSDFPRKKIKRPSSKLAIEALEPRMLFSADVLFAAVHDGGDGLADELDLSAGEFTGIPGAVREIRFEIVVVDRSTPGHESLVDDLLRHQTESIRYKLVFIEPDQNGVEIITHALANMHAEAHDHPQMVDAVHIISHGTAGQVQIGNVLLNQKNFANHAADFQQWSSSLDSNGDLLFYGCDLASNDDGRLLLAHIASATGADVAASEDLTGSFDKGGDWSLEAELGVIETANPFSAQLQNDYGELLSTSPLLDWSLPSTVLENSSVPITGSNLSTSDSDTDAVDLIYSFTSPLNGYIAYASAPWATITSFSQQDINDGEVVYVNTSGGTSDFIDFQVSDGDPLGTVASGRLDLTIESAPITDISSGIEMNGDGGNNAYLQSIAIAGPVLQSTTVEVIFAASDVPDSVPVFTIYDGVSAQTVLSIDTNTGNLVFGVGSDVLVSNTVDYRSVLDNTPHSLAMTWRSTDGNWSVYVDGELVDRGVGLNADMNLDLSSVRVLLGSDGSAWDAGTYFSGNYYDVRLWDYARSAAEVSHLHDIKLQTPDSRLIANWQMTELNAAGRVMDTITGNPLSAVYASGAGSINSVVQEDLNVNENSNSGTPIGYLLPHEVESPRVVNVDGDFLEAATPTSPASSNTYTAGQNLGGWTVNSGVVEHIRADGVYSDNTLLGGNSVRLDDATASITQLIATEPGRLYQLNYSVAGDFSSQTDPVGVIASVGNQSETVSVSMQAGWDVANNLQWQHQSTLFAADGVDTTLAFSALVPDAMIADVRVIEIPLEVAGVLAGQANMSYDAVTNKFYKKLEQKTTAPGSENIAANQTVYGVSSRNVTIHSAYENARVHAITSNQDDSTWIGANDSVLEGEWRWNLGNGESKTFWVGDFNGDAVDWSYENWKQGLEPNDYQPNGGEDYATMDLQGYWNDEPVLTGLNYAVFEWDAASVLNAYQVMQTGNAFNVDPVSLEVSVGSGAILDHESTPVETFDVTIDDIDGRSDVRALEVTINDINEAPVSLSSAITVVEDSYHEFSLADINYSDVEAHQLHSLIIRTLPANGSLEFSGVPVTLNQIVLSADIPSLRFIPGSNDNGLSYDNFLFDVRDVGGTLDGGADTSTNAANFIFNVIAVNDAPRGSDVTVNTLENTDRVFMRSDFLFDDAPENNSFLGVYVNGFSGSGSFLHSNSPVANNQWIPVADIDAGLFKFSPTPSVFGSGLAQLSFSVKDNGGVANGGVDTDSVPNQIFVNVTEVKEPPSGTDNTITLLEDGSYVFKSIDFGFSDADGDQFVELVVDTLPLSGTLLYDNVAVTADQRISVAMIDSGLLEFVSSPDVYGNAVASFDFSVVDDSNANSVSMTSNTIVFDVTGVNDPPAAKNNTITIVEDTVYDFALTDFGFIDPEGDDFDSMFITSVPAVGTLTLSGAVVSGGSIVSAADISNLAYTVSANFSGSTGTAFTFLVKDTGGTTNGGLNVALSHNIIDFNVLPSNDSPQGIDTTRTINEDSTHTFSVSDFGFTDVESDGLYSVQLVDLPVDGNLLLNGSPVVANQTILVTDLSNLVYTPAPDANGITRASMTFKVTDDGGALNGGVDTDPVKNLLVFDILSVNDAPTGTDKTIAVSEYSTYTFSAADFGFSDIEADGFATTTIKSLPSIGNLFHNNNSVGVGQVINAGQISGLKYQLASSNGIATTSFDFQVQDAGGTANGGIDLDPTANTIMFSLTDVNLAPNGTDKTIAINEDFTYTYSTSDFGFADADGDQLAAIEIVSLPANGTLTLAGGPVSASQLIPAAQISGLVFTPAQNANGAGYSSVGFKVIDDGGTANGGTNTDPVANLISFDVNSVNDAPSGSDATVPVNENDVYSFSPADFGFSDIEPNNFATVRIVTLPVTGQLLHNGVVVSQNSVINAGAISNLEYHPGSNPDELSTVGFDFHVQDTGGTANGGADTDPVANTITFVLKDVNNAPQGSDQVLGVEEDSSYFFSTADFGFSDQDAHGFASVEITTVPALGGLVWMGIPVVPGQTIPSSTVGNLSYQPAANDSGVGYSSFTFKVIDDGGTANGGLDTDPTPNTIIIDVTPVNDAPQGSDGNRTINEDTGYIFSSADFGFTDSDGNQLASVEIVGIPANGTLSFAGSPVSVPQVIPGSQIPDLVFTPALNTNGIAYGSISFKVRDDGGTANNGMDTDLLANDISFDVSGVNDAPSGSDITVAVNEGGVHTFAASEFGFSDVESDTFSSVRLATLPATGSLLLNGDPVVAGQLVNSSVISALEYQPGSNPANATRDSFEFQVIDSGGTSNGGVDIDQSSNTFIFAINDVNKAPQGHDNLLVLVEDGSYTFTVLDFGFSDQDAHEFESVEIVTVPVKGSLTFMGSVVTAGQSIAVGNLSGLTYTPVPDEHGTAYSDMTFKVKDDGGVAFGGVDIDPVGNDIVFDVLSVNDAPEGTDSTLAVDEYGSHNFVPADFGFSDLDANDFATLTINSLPAVGILQLSGAPVAIGEVINAGQLVNLQYLPGSAGTGGSASFDFHVSDNGGVSNGGIDTDATDNTITFNIANVNVAPEGKDNAILVAEDENYVFNIADFGFTDNDSNNLQAVEITALPVSGSLTHNGFAVVAGQVIAAGDISDLLFAPPPNANGIEGLAFKVIDDGGVANGGSNTDTTANLITLNILSVNDAPNGSDKSISVAEYSEYRLRPSDFGFSDLESDNFATVTIISVPATGTLLHNGNPVVAGQIINAGALSGLEYQLSSRGNSSTTNFDFLVQDTGGTANGGVDTDPVANTITFNLLDVNHAPSGTDKTIDFPEGTSHTFSAADFGFTDADGHNLKAVEVVSIPLSGSLLLNGNSVVAGQQIQESELSDLIYTATAYNSGNTHAALAFKLVDDGGTLNGGTDTDTSTKIFAFNLLPVNNAPAGIDHTVQGPEDIGYRFSEADFGITDIDGHGLQSVTITSLPLRGVLILDGVVVTTGQQINSSDLSKLVYTPPADQFGVSFSQFDFIVTDDGGVGNGGADTDASANVITIDVAPVNDPPAGSDSTVTLAEDSETVFNLQNFAFNDFEGHDLLGITVEQLPSAGTLLFSGIPVEHGELVLAADIDAGLLSFKPNTDSSQTSIFQFTLIDTGGTMDGGQDTDPVSRQIILNVTNISDAPNGTNGSISLSEDNPYTIQSKDFGFSDVDNDSFAGIVLGVLPARGSIELNGVPVETGDYIARADVDAGMLLYVPAANDFGSGNRVGFYVQDTGDAVTGDNTDITERFIQFGITGVNDAPVLGTNNLVVNEGESVVVSGTELYASDVDNDALSFTIDSMPQHGVILKEGVMLNAGDRFTLDDVVNNRVRYEHDGSETSTDVVAISLLDEIGNPVRGELMFKIIDVIDPAPDLTDDQVEVPYGQNFQSSLASGSGNTSLLDNDTYNGGDYTISLEAPASHGVVTINSDGTFSYRHDGTENLQDSFSYRVSNSDGAYSVATVSVVVEPEISPAISIQNIAPAEYNPSERVSLTEEIQHETETPTEIKVEQLQNETEEAGDAEDEENTDTETDGIVGDAHSEALLDTNSVAELLLEANVLPDVEIRQAREPGEGIAFRLATGFDDQVREVGIRHHNRLEGFAFEQGQQQTALNEFTIDIFVPIHDPASVVDNRSFQQSLNQVGNALEEPQKEQQRRIELGKDAAVGVSISVTAGALAWLLRGGSLMAAMIATTPLWNNIDPLKVMSAGAKNSTDEDADVEQMFE